MKNLNIEIKCFARNKQLNKTWWTFMTQELSSIILKETNKTDYKKHYLYVSVNIINNKKIKEINNTYRNIDKETDVLSFPLWKDNIPQNLSILELGDIFISLQKVNEQALIHEHSNYREAAFLFAHGFLHLLGYDHETAPEEAEMIILQNKCLDLAGFEREK